MVFNERTTQQDVYLRRSVILDYGGARGELGVRVGWPRVAKLLPRTSATFPHLTFALAVRGILHTVTNSVPRKKE